MTTTTMLKERDDVRLPHDCRGPVAEGDHLIAAVAIAAAIATGPAYTIPADQVSYTQCVARRESNNHPTSVNRAGGYYGLFQFSDALADGATWHMLDWLKTWHPRPGRFAAELRDLPMNRWPRNLQVAAFVETLNHNGKWSGAKHWAGGRFHCAAVAR